jgi:Haem-binding domain
MRSGATPVIALAMIFAAAQMVPVDRSSPPATGELDAPLEVARSLRAACYDCHSNRTRWPWYSRVAPASWIVVRHVESARRRLNFSDWADYASDPGTKIHKLEEIKSSIADGTMAPWYYRMLHPEARLSGRERAAISAWIAHQTATPETPAASRPKNPR